MTKKDHNHNVKEALQEIRKHTAIKPHMGLILGSGLGDFADTFENAVKIPTETIPHYPRSTVEGHRGYLVFGQKEGSTLMAVQGRTHYYEGYSLGQVSFVVDLMHALGVKVLLVTNAAGSVNPRLTPGRLMLITDQVSFFFNSPLRGIAHFSDMSNPYSSEWHDDIEKLALNEGITLHRGVLWSSSGPTYETSAEVNMIRKFGADAASMSTAPEVIRANALGLKTLGISCITNFATGISANRLSHKEVTETAQDIKATFIHLVSIIIRYISKKNL